MNKLRIIKQKNANFDYQSFQKIIPLLVFMVTFLTFGFLKQVNRDGLPSGDSVNGGILLPDDFEKVVIADIFGRVRHSMGKIFIGMHLHGLRGFATF